MNQKFLALALISSALTLSAFASVRDGSNGSRAPLPAQRPNDFVRVTQYSTDRSSPTKSVLLATHIGGPVQNEAIAVNAVAVQAPRVSPATAVVARAETKTPVALAQRE